ncbi:MAG: ATP-binding cassette domain-containing protein [Alphaproteobacteria bacterium]|jgi:ABC-2 type transport system ATP-binding protein|nr:ATP-binding cassette domain-containing protein [Alphaproteobacteria bacterium]|tara:strand:+ start:682 stop:1407 length:726 start_codon:yes stop_codon:yes gene_type:complete
MENITLDIKSLSKSYGLIKALNDVSFSLAEGEYASLLGPNGAGKTTLFQILTGLFVSEKGNVLINDFDMRSNAINALAHIGVVFQQITLDMDLTVMENLKFHSNLHGINDKEFKKRVIIELEQVNLSDRINDKVRSLSGGQKRRVELARSLLHKPKLLLLDEPTVGLDPQSRRDLLDYVIKLKKERKMAVLWATHLVDEAEKSDTVIILNKGKIIKKDTPQNITKEYNKDTLHDAFVSLTS